MINRDHSFATASHGSDHHPREVDHQVTVHILYDGDTLLWHTDPGSFAFVAQEQFSH